MEFGHKFKETHFQVKPGFVPVNHGSFGMPPTCVLDKYVDAFRAELASPDTYHYVTHEKVYADAIQAVAAFVNCPAQNLALMSNATSAVNAVLCTYPFQKGDKILLFSTTYGACANTVRFLARKIGVVPVVVDLDLPMSHTAMVDRFRAAVEAHDVKLALVDVVSSMPSAVFPYHEITALCKRYGVLSLVDGAHAAGLVPLDFRASGFEPDFFVSNIHKWLSVPKGCAMLYVDPKHHRDVQTLPISHSYTDPDAELSPHDEENLFLSKFAFSGTTVFATLSCIPTALQFRSEVCGGEEKIRDYCYSLARKAGRLTEEMWPGAAVLENAESTLVCAMVTVRVPLGEFSPDFDAGDPNQTKPLVKYVLPRTIEKHNTYVQLNFYKGQCVVRWSCQVYNELSDYAYAVDAIRDVLQEYFSQHEKANL